ncbi:PHD-finger [Seminavis robusta]|uniref:PHD-finger n=1 Tax=Seminavis robusta TaxID=568900 RepID=A0A9N8DS39_9STRA|nr:PHD-finger [Seminavis robusta]|eukprot:Sro316_g115530.1 PHD-finger (686) ;mRNA; f:39105-41411
MATTATNAVTSTPVRGSTTGKRGGMTPSYVWVKMAKNNSTSHQAELLEILPDGYLVRWTISNREQKISLSCVLEQDMLGRRRTRGRNHHRLGGLSSAEEEDNNEEEDESSEKEEETKENSSEIQKSLFVSEEALVKPSSAKKQKSRKRRRDTKKGGKRSKSSKKTKPSPGRKPMHSELEEENDQSDESDDNRQVHVTHQPLLRPVPVPPSPSLFVSLFEIHNIVKSKAVARVAQLLQTEGFPDAADFCTEFFLFAHERQSCWQRRNNDANPQWSKSPILQNYSFANVYRALDRGTCFARYQFGEQYLLLCKNQQLLEQQQKNKKNRQNTGVNDFSSLNHAIAASMEVVETNTTTGDSNNNSGTHSRRPCTKLQKSVRRKDWIPKLLWASYCYRQVNRIEPFLDFGGIPDIPKCPTDLTRFLDHVNQMELQQEEESETIFFAPANSGTPSLLSYDDYRIHLQRLTVSSGWVLKKAGEELAKCKSLHSCWDELLKRMPGMEASPDIAWLVLCDLLEAGCLQVSSTTDAERAMDLCYLSPESLELLSASCWKTSTDDETRAFDLLKLLTEKQDDFFAAVGVKFPTWNGRRLALKDLAHCLSQFSKYLQIQSDMRSRVHSPSHRLLVSRSHLDVSKTCRFCDTESDDGLFCDSCLCYYCRDCEAESCKAAPEYWMCRPCRAMDQMHLTD